MGICGSLCDDTPTPVKHPESVLPTGGGYTLTPAEEKKSLRQSGAQKAQDDSKDIIIQLPRKHVHRHDEATADQTYNTKIPSHTVTETNHHSIHYPDHPPRVDTPLYKKTHAKLCFEENEDLGCLICGKNRKRDKVVTETHHFFCEKAAELGIDWIKFGEESYLLVNPQTKLCLANAGFDWEEVAKDPHIFVDSEANMIVLCPLHHRSEECGIHHVPYPEWILQKFAKKGFKFLDEKKKD
jgi:hypothetical protein